MNEQSDTTANRTGRSDALSRKGQTVGLVIAGTMLIWLAANWAGPALGLPGRYALLIDFAALAALFWAMVVIYQMWQARSGTDRK